MTPNHVLLRTRHERRGYNPPIPCAGSLTKLPKRQRMKLAEELWFSSVDDTLPVSPAHKKIIDERWTAYKAGKMKRITLPELERRLARS